ncbi:HD domain-containing protein [Vaginisenegalia massiliensis]|uniref:HD domain-containing protein n=1 Tax=Vaginisenegalia massiliensis TaxID=2058294 RepID=UPI000F5468AB|nr:HD domain-containing protein [Vaginisenegalia massiliensis]
MKNTDLLLQHPLFLEKLQALEAAEADRFFCKHDLEHFLAVARICYIHCLEEGLAINKDVIYVAALLHDLGRVDQYQAGIPHDQASYQLAQRLLSDLDFTVEEEGLILQAIAKHRQKDQTDSASFASFFALADKESRLCFHCPAYSACKWSPTKKNRTIHY